jgi:hypothetical protein
MAPKTMAVDAMALPCGWCMAEGNASIKKLAAPAPKATQPSFQASGYLR